MRPASLGSGGGGEALKARAKRREGGRGWRAASEASSLFSLFLFLSLPLPPLYSSGLHRDRRAKCRNSRHELYRPQILHRHQRVGSDRGARRTVGGKVSSRSQQGRGWRQSSERTDRLALETRACTRAWVSAGRRTVQPRQQGTSLPNLPSLVVRLYQACRM